MQIVERRIETDAPGTRSSGKGAPPGAGDTRGAIVTAPAEAKPKSVVTPTTKSKKDKPTKKAKSKKAKPPKAVSLAKPAKAKRVKLKLRVSADIEKAFKRAAEGQKVKRGELLARIFTDWRSRNPA